VLTCVSMRVKCTVAARENVALGQQQVSKARLKRPYFR
jgi:hypothetical protein